MPAGRTRLQLSHCGRLAVYLAGGRQRCRPTGYRFRQPCGSGTVPEGSVSKGRPLAEAGRPESGAAPSCSACDGRKTRRAVSPTRRAGVPCRSRTRMRVTLRGLVDHDRTPGVAKEPQPRHTSQRLLRLAGQSSSRPGLGSIGRRRSLAVSAGGPDGLLAKGPPAGLGQGTESQGPAGSALMLRQG